MTMKFICEICKNEYGRPTYTSRDSKSTKEYWRNLEGTEHGKCTECYKKEKQEEKEREAAKAAEYAKEKDLPELTGSEKQIAWATELRNKFVKASEEMSEKRKEEMAKLAGMEYPVVIDRIIKSKTESHWWIENRELKIGTIVDAAKEIIVLPEKKEEKEVDAKAEATAYPEKPVTEAVVEISYTSDIVTASFEKNDKFMSIVKNLGFKWNNKWEKQIMETTGTAEERAAETGNALLNAGFPIRIYNPKILENAVKGNFKPENKNWIYRRREGKYEGWLVIKWQGQNDRLYSVARKLPGSAWDNGVMVKPEHNKEIEEFASLYGFEFTQSARSEIEKQKQVKEKAAVVKAAKVENKPKDGLVEILKSGDDVIDDLKD